MPIDHTALQRYRVMQKVATEFLKVLLLRHGRTFRDVRGGCFVQGVYYTRKGLITATLERQVDVIREEAQRRIDLETSPQFARDVDDIFRWANRKAKR